MDNSIQNPALRNMYWQEEPTAKEGSPDQKLDQEDFFKLLTQQLNMQDPTKPVENDQMIAQMTNFTMAEGITNMSDQFKTFTENMTSNQALQASTLVGRQVMVPTNEANIPLTGGGANGAIALQQSGFNTKLTVENAQGQVVKNISLGDLEAGVHDFEWDGTDANGNPVPPGNYSISANARMGTSNEELPVQMRAHVNSVSMGGGEGIVLNLRGLGGVKLADVSEIG
ncbi:flagellar basal-body rod modification protein FlgD [Pseudidiomarina planktonica]|uniref:Basal-body rod modification protein FlgD n=1 Tax=Pseudidiomarina planktonica TaxID=1323738 RepID=A0A1Y6EI03_9GAMM|nr:flagellar hook assembly protein FlgD [Pseudidiomarina planktonica]RUO65885.1 flagellar hook assembly protein FlgD [Pseudidiomarina planktonica]SMQ62056.1 flagellar basal-body rod modification protein FlgD [Pseudidiomarina planktonica]